MPRHMSTGLGSRTTHGPKHTKGRTHEPRNHRCHHRHPGHHHPSDRDSPTDLSQVSCKHQSLVRLSPEGRDAWQRLRCRCRGIGENDERIRGKAGRERGRQFKFGAGSEPRSRSDRLHGRACWSRSGHEHNAHWRSGGRRRADVGGVAPLEVQHIGPARSVRLRYRHPPHALSRATRSQPWVKVIDDVPPGAGLRQPDSDPI